MPTYDYRCTVCEHRWEEFASITAKPTKKCPGCGKPKAERLISGGAGLIFRGSGFYLTDYRSDSYKKGAAADQKSSEASSTSKDSSGSSGSSGSDTSGSGGSGHTAAGNSASSTPAKNSADKGSKSKTKD